MVLPGIAASQLRNRLARHGRVVSVVVDAFPAVELLWHHADAVQVRLGSFTTAAGDASLGALLAQTADVDKLDASVGTLTTGLLTVRDAELRKRGNGLAAAGTLLTGDLAQAVPFLADVRPVPSSDGTLILQGTASVFGASITAQATVAADQGRVLVAPTGLAGLVTVTAFADPRVSVDSVSATPAAGGFRAAATGHLR